MQNNSENKISFSSIATIVVIAISLIVFALFMIKKIDKSTKAKVEQTQPSDSESLIGGDFSLESTKDINFTQRDLKGKISLLYFGFGHCPDVCPTTMQVITVALENIPQIFQDKVQTLFVTLDPERDTIESLKGFVAKFHPSTIGLRGDKEQLKQITENYKIYFSKEKSKTNDKNDYLVDHSSVIYLLDKEGKYVNHFTYKNGSEEITTAVLKIINN